MRLKKRIVCIVGTRPEAIKMAPVIMKLQEASWAETIVVATGQHRELLDQSLSAFGLKVHQNLEVMVEGQSLSRMTARLFDRLEVCLSDLAPDILLAQGDTTSVMVAAVSCFYQNIPFGHVEAGLRTADIHLPFPEEFNRRVAGLLSTLHFAPTSGAQANLRRAAVPDANIFVTGNTCIDALYWMKERAPPLPFSLREGSRLALVTAHRRENMGEPMRQMFQAILDLRRRYPDLEFIYPVHPNPGVRQLARDMLSREEGIHLCPPLDYPTLVSVLARSMFVLTDSGGLQEEAPALGKPVLVMRSETERPEAVEMGVARLVGSNRDQIIAEVSRLLEDQEAYRSMAKGVSPYGDGKAAERICEHIRAYLDA
ncbi:UDP-N-acetylglucosamine 2-epimerase (non-hydrolyzing) [Microvirga sp. CF3062]|uniref:non-hydrolyzing UDP-N-acetylglucosamine 2-epimerase n=1 Tax=Microvirga sp. CF3062 TaxID=3110182 RepID=UPI002E761CF4|nr:UDP-N-acetylglucosamine 2-epimerase (non-hydrolyzing) [Microvirga sp. CF3062]MEE1657664.1 UDP-N-acetylglucosamine 2-epimerase (non-hydrolyzing) [Microvirga sp. CF3062]